MMSSMTRLTVNVKVKDSNQNKDDKPHPVVDEEAIIEKCIERVMAAMASLQAR
ncbi:MAG: hypothetical protein ACI8WB_001018 [Phenylobacterium sp.]|jgi:hypothetical protein